MEVRYATTSQIEEGYQVLLTNPEWKPRTDGGQEPIDGALVYAADDEALAHDLFTVGILRALATEFEDIFDALIVVATKTWGKIRDEREE